jgi:hypothetical protein
MLSRRHAMYPKSVALDALLMAVRALAPYGTNNIGRRVSMLSLFFSFRNEVYGTDFKIPVESVRLVVL